MSVPNFEFPGDDWTTELMRRSLAEDIGSGDATTMITTNGDAEIEAMIVARDSGVIAGLPLVKILFGQLDPTIEVVGYMADGQAVQPGHEIAILKGNAAAILTGERTLLNFLQHLSGIATLTAQYVQQVRGTKCKVLDTRKTLPGYRHLAKYAVRCGGGHNHRMGLYDRIMLKDNHWATAQGPVAELVARGRQDFPQLAIEVEVDSLSQLEQVLPLQVEWIMLDNFTFSNTEKAVKMRDSTGSNSRLESSGNVTLETIAGYAQTGVDAASVGRLTHSPPALDLGLDMDQRG